MTKYTVNRNSPVPVYYQITLNMRQRISGGEWRAGNKLPPELELTKQYNVSRMTFRQALGELVKEGILIRRRGVGTFVSQGYVSAGETSAHEQLSEALSLKDKSDLRQQVWQELRKVAKPDSRFHWDFEKFVPDFAKSARCVDSIRKMECYKDSKILFIAPDNSLTRIRQQAIEDHKQIIVATHAIVRGFLTIESNNIPPGCEAFAATLDGIEHFGRPISLEEIIDLASIDLLITGISLVTESGVRWGKGHGYFDLEWGIFREIGAVEDNTPIVAVGHDCQVVSTDLEPSEVDTIVDAIVTPTRVIRAEKKYPKPNGILWQYISPELRDQIPPVQILHTQRLDE
ncbi:MAG: GntR family transcriptional regulator [Chloroflexi bacterium]|nr:GntR family transcriptional regulator [Chloroflexota bacterium]MBL7162897.1 GntR family transcriptional regulator [Anaerolineales bacterium]